MQKHNTSIELSVNKKTGTMTFLVTGKSQDVKTSRATILNDLSVHVTESMLVPVSVRPYILGKGGSTLKALTAKTRTTINILRNSEKSRHPDELDAADEASVDNEDEEDQQQVVNIIGAKEAVLAAKKEIDAIVALRSSKHMIRLKIDRSFHPFIVGPNNAGLNSLQKDLNVKIHIVPIDVTSSADKDMNEILIVGERAAAIAAEARIIQTYKELNGNIRSLTLPIPKKKHRFIIGNKGAVLHEIFAKTNCFIEVPQGSDNDENVVVRGRESLLTVALQLVLEKANSVFIDEIDVSSLIPKNVDANLLLRYIYIKERALLKNIESENDVNIYQASAHTNNSKPSSKSQDDVSTNPRFEIHAHSIESLKDACSQLKKLLREWGKTLYFGVVDIPFGLHRFIVGKGGQNISKLKNKAEFKDRLVDIIIPAESAESDDVLLVVLRDASITAVAAGDADASSFLKHVSDEILSSANALADLTTLQLKIDPKYHKRVIGIGGAMLKEFLAPYGSNVSVQLPKLNEAVSSGGHDVKLRDSVDDSTITIKGPGAEASKVAEAIEKFVNELRHIEVMTSYSETVETPKGFAVKLVGRQSSPNSIGWIANAIREKYTKKEFKVLPTDKSFEKELSSTGGTLYLSTSFTETSQGETITINGPKSFVTVAKKVIEERLQRLVDTIDCQFNVFEEVSEEAKDILADPEGSNSSPQLKNSLIRRLIGKDGKNIKRISSAHDVLIRFKDSKRATAAAPDATENAAEEEPFDASNLGLLLIQGPKTSVKEAKNEIVEFIDQELVRANSLSFVLPLSTLSRVLGRGGSNVNELKEKYNVAIDLTDDSESDIVQCTVQGAKKNCFAVKEEIMNLVDQLVNISTTNIPVPSFLHRLMIGSSGATIRKVIEDLGGTEKIRINFPKSKPESDDICVTCHEDSIDTVKEALAKLVVEVIAEYKCDKSDSRSVFTKQVALSDADVLETVTIPQSESSFVLGRNKDTLIDLMSTHGVTFWVEEEDPVKIHIVGSKELESQVKRCAKEIKSKVRTSKKVPLPEGLNAILQSDGDSATQDAIKSKIKEILQRFRTDNGVRGVLSTVSTDAINQSVIELIGEAKKIEAAAKSLSKLLETLDSNKIIVKIPIEQEIRPHIIGRGGQKIKQLQEQSGAILDMVRATNTLVIRGSSKEVVDKAVSLVQNIISTQAERLNRDRQRASETVSSSVNGQESGRNSAKGKPNEGNVDRFDDIQVSVKSKQKPTDVPGHVPIGFNGRNGAGQGFGVRVSSLCDIPFKLNFNAVASADSSTSKGGWQSVGKKTISKATLVVENGDVGASDDVPDGSKKSKKKKKKSKTDNTTTGNNEEDAGFVLDLKSPTQLGSNDTYSIDGIAHHDVVHKTTKLDVDSAVHSGFRPDSPLSPVTKHHEQAANVKKSRGSNATDKDLTEYPAPAVQQTVSKGDEKGKDLPTGASSLGKIVPPTQLTVEERSEYLDDGWTTVNNSKRSKNNSSSGVTPTLTASSSVLSLKAMGERIANSNAADDDGSAAESKKKNKKNKKKKKKKNGGLKEADVLEPVIV